MPVYLCVDGTIPHAEPTDLVRTMMSSLAHTISDCKAAATIRLAVVAFGERPSLACPLFDISCPPDVPSLLRAGPLRVTALLDYLDLLIGHDVDYFTDSGATIVRPSVFTIVGRALRDDATFGTPRDATNVDPLRLNFGIHEARSATVASLGGGWLAESGHPADQLATLTTALRECIAATAMHIAGGTGTLIEPRLTQGWSRLDEHGASIIESVTVQPQHAGAHYVPA
jgi:uncharacterized protein YegL